MIQHLKRNRYKTNMRNLTIFTRALKSLKNLRINRLLLNKVYNVSAKIDLWIVKWRKEFGKVLPEHSEVSKMRLLWDSFIQRGVMYHDNEQWFKIWRGIDLPFQNWHHHLTTFPEHLNISKIFTLIGFFWPKYIIFELKMYRRVMLDGTEGWWKIWKNTCLWFPRWHEEFVKFS